MAKLTIRDIAALSGLSKSTVSLVLNNSPKVDPATRRHVLAVIRRHNYVPSFAATALAKGSTRLIGMIVPGLSWHMVASINIGVAAVTERTGFDIILYTATNDRDYGPLIDRILTSSMSSGLLVVSHEQPLEPLVQLHQDGMPVVLVNTIGSEVALPSVTADNYEGALTAMDHLLQLGHERIACMQGRMEYRCCQDRYRGYLDALRSAGIQPDPELTKPGDFVPDQIKARSRELFAMPADERPTAVFAHSDVTAYAVMTAASEAGLRVPEDVSVIGFDDIESAAQIRPPLTTIQQPFVEMGKRAADLLLTAIRANDENANHENANENSGELNRERVSPDPVRLSMPTSLIVRASCGPVPVTRSRRGRSQTTKA
ncbi:LacI family transcriptional regulator [Kribbella sp. VKM Ac-2527]|uniref:LacI family transcriptional regulator n=1 Tax=Kribbella caucasensis TaxID=2512215 RepID=A0A4R6K6Y2_9ACTN|nr:LacI family DNA-binding transcriptional regulator [Kribbella sp. VKM Ac-2527]TDO44322.1 LacI family transcriptional regulator [Kribbella sp. VKM Ac-2527]